MKYIFKKKKNRPPANCYSTIYEVDRPVVHFVTFSVIRSRENFENERKSYAIEKIVEMKLWAKGTHLFFHVNGDAITQKSKAETFFKK